MRSTCRSARRCRRGVALILLAITRFVLSFAIRQVKGLLQRMMSTIHPRSISPRVLLVIVALTVGIVGVGCTGSGNVSTNGTGALATPGGAPPEYGRTEQLPPTDTLATPAVLTPTPNASIDVRPPTPAIATPPPESKPEPTGYGPFALPMRVRIPRINVDAAIETVGLDENGEMSPPRKHENVAWYGYSPPPGSPGASVFAGHVDSVDGPAVFWSLRDLRPGDHVDVDLIDGTTQRFVVEGSGWYAPDEAPLRTIFSWDGPPRLHLITCGGVFDHSRRTYTQRLVVYARLDPGSSAQRTVTPPDAFGMDTHVPPLGAVY